MSLPVISVDKKATTLTIGSLTLYYSYETIVGFRKGNELFVCENRWSTMTGKHIKAIPGSKKTIPYPQEVFQDLLMEATEHLT